jgi:hypothetical protein
MMIDREVKAALINLMSICKKKGIPLAGGVELSSKISFFNNLIDFEGDQGKSLEAIVKAKGDVNQYLIEMSKINSSQDEFISVDGNDEAPILESNSIELMYLKTNPQVTKTKH